MEWEYDPECAKYVAVEETGDQDDSDEAEIEEEADDDKETDEEGGAEE